MSVEVAIIGSGISGAFAAWHLARRGLQVVLLDRRAPAQGSTMASTALIQYELDERLIDIAARQGADVANRAYLVCRQALDWLDSLGRELDEDVGLRERPTVFAAKHERDLASMRQECDARRAIGIECRWADRTDLLDRFGVNRPGGIVSDKSFEVDPLRLTKSLLRGAIALGATLYSPVTVGEYVTVADGAELRTREGQVVRAKSVVMASGYEAPNWVREGRGELLSTFAAVSQPIADLDALWPGRAMVWEFAEPYLYARTAGDRVMFGGEDERYLDQARRDAAIDLKTAILVRKIADLLPNLPPLVAEKQWAGTFATSNDGMPFIGTHPDHPAIHVAFGYGGNGILFGLIAAKIITGEITGDATLAAERELFRLDR